MHHRLSLRTLAIVLAWLAIWQITAAIVANDILLAGPADVIRSLFMQIFTSGLLAFDRDVLLKNHGRISTRLFCGNLARKSLLPLPASWRDPRSPALTDEIRAGCIICDSCTDLGGLGKSFDFYLLFCCVSDHLCQYTLRSCKYQSKTA